MPKSHTYYTLCLRDNNHGFRPEFGDYDRETVEYEMECYTEHDYRKCNAKIICTGDSQAEINEGVAKLNA